MSFELQEELTLLAEEKLFVQNALDESAFDDPQDVNAALNNAVDSLANSSDAIADERVFDTFRSLLQHSSTLTGSMMSKLLDSLLSGFSAEVDATTKDSSPTDHSAYRAHRPALEMYAYLLQWFVVIAENDSAAKAGAEGATGRGKKAKAPAKNKKNAAENWSWAASLPDLLSALSRGLLRLRSERIWQTTQERDTFISCFVKPANRIAESEAYMKEVETRTGVYKVLALAAKNHGQAFNVQTTIMQNLQYFEHLAEPMAELITILSKEFDYSQLGEEVLRDLASKQFSAQDTKGPRAFGRFLGRLAEVNPRIVLKQIVVLQKHLDSEAYSMRMALLDVLGLLIKELSISEEGDPEQTKVQLEGFFDLVLERFLDLNSYVRSKVANVLIKTCELPIKFPKLRIRITDLTIRSLEDKSSQVRKNCIALLTKLITTHPYGRLHGGELAMEEWKARLDKLDEELKVLDLPSREEAEALAEARQLMEDGEKSEAEAEEADEEGGEGDESVLTVKAGEASGSEQEDEDDDNDDINGSPSKRKSPKAKKSAKKSKKAPRKSDGIDLAAVDQSQLLASVDAEALTRLRLTKKYYTDAIGFITLIERAVPVVADLLASTVKSEVLEAMDFFKVAYEYKIEMAEIGIKKMLHLIWSKDETSTEEDGKELKGIRSRLIECYSQLYFEPLEGLTPKEQVNRVAKNMIELTRDATLAEITSLEALMTVMMAKGVVPDEAVKRLWSVYSTTKEIPKFQRRGSIIVLGMLANSRMDVVAENVDLILRVGLGPLGKSDLVLSKYSCIALSRLAGNTKTVKGSLEDATKRFGMDTPIFARLQDIIQTPSGSKEWFAMAEQAINTIYGLGDQPDTLCSQFIKEMTALVFSPPPASATPAAPAAASEEDAATEGEKTPQPEEEETEASATQSQRSASQAPADPPMMANAYQLSQLIFIAGHCAIKQIVHLELVEKEFKRRKAEEDKKNGPKAAGQDELDQVAGSVEDDIGDAIAHAKEKELMYGPQSLLAVFGPMSAAIVSQPKVYRNAMLKTAATLALGKFMCVSARFCEEHLVLLFKILETSREPSVRSNIVIALGDIAVCFSTIMDEKSDQLYAGLHDKDLTVKKNTLMVLTHLILNGMIKVKGQLGEMAKCLEDDDKRISDLAHLFFTELSTKDKAIYNNLPDIISHLSSGKHAVSEETFCKSMKFIFSFVDKKREAESVVEKLCQRFRLATEPRQWRDIAYCLSLLPFNSEVAVKKLVEGLPAYQDKLHEEGVYKRFQEILAKARSNKVAKNEADLQEFENALAEHKAKGVEDAEMVGKVTKQKKKAAKKTSRKKKQATPVSDDSDY